MPAGGHALPKFYMDNFTKLDRVKNNSGQFFWQCNHCGKDSIAIEGQDNRLYKHIISYEACPKAPGDACVQARALLMARGHAEVWTVSDSGSPTPGALLAQDSQSLVITKKRKSQGTLEGFVDHAMTATQKESANLKFLR